MWKFLFWAAALVVMHAGFPLAHNTFQYNLNRGTRLAAPTCVHFENNSGGYLHNQNKFSAWGFVESQLNCTQFFSVLFFFFLSEAASHTDIITHRASKSHFPQGNGNLPPHLSYAKFVIFFFFHLRVWLFLWNNGVDVLTVCFWVACSSLMGGGAPV